MVFDAPATHVFDIGRFREETMAFPPSVTIKDFQSEVSQGYPNPKPGGTPARFPTIIQIVPAPPPNANRSAFVASAPACSSRLVTCSARSPVVGYPLRDCSFCKGDVESVYKTADNDGRMADPFPIARTAGGVDILFSPAVANRHGLITGATGTGKTVSLQVLADHFSAIGVPVFLADVKGDLTGLAAAGSLTPKMKERLAATGVTNRRGAPIRSCSGTSSASAGFRSAPPSRISVR